MSDALVVKAELVAERAYAPYSNYRVGAVEELGVADGIGHGVSWKTARVTSAPSSPP